MHLSFARQLWERLVAQPVEPGVPIPAHPLLRQPARFRATPSFSTKPSVAEYRSIIEPRVARTHEAVQSPQVSAQLNGVGLLLDDAITQALQQAVQQHQWRGLSTWRAKGRDLRLRWSPLPSNDPVVGAAVVALKPTSAAPAAAAPAPVAPAGGPQVLLGHEAPTLVTAIPAGLPQPASLVDAGLLVLRTACPYHKAAITHAAWGRYLEGRLPLRAGQGPDGSTGVGAGAGGGLGASGAAESDGRAAADGGEREALQRTLERDVQPGPQLQQQEGQRAPAGEVDTSLDGLLPAHPARPERPRLVRPKEIPGHECSPLGLNGYMLHNLAHIELNAIDLAWDTVVRFSHLGLPDLFYEDFARVADDESRHLGWCLQRLGELGHRYGDMDAHDLLWLGCHTSAGDLAARLAVVPMSQEARGLDAGGRLVQRLVGFGDLRSAAVVGLISEEERAHVAVGVTWFARICAALGLQAGPLYRRWLLHLNPDLLKGPFNHTERNLVGLPREWYDPASWEQLPGETYQQPKQEKQQPQERKQQKRHLNQAEQQQKYKDKAGSGLPERQPARAGAALTADEGPLPPQAAASRRQGAPVPVRGSPCPRLEDPQPLLSGAQLALLAERLAVFAELEGAAAGSDSGGQQR